MDIIKLHQLTKEIMDLRTQLNEKEKLLADAMAAPKIKSGNGHKWSYYKRTKHQARMKKYWDSLPQERKDAWIKARREGLRRKHGVRT